MVESKLNPKALEKYSESFSTIILDNFFDQNEAISGQQIVDLTKIKQLNFFVLKVLFSQWQEETKKFKSPLFDYNNEDVKQSLKNLVNTLSKHIYIKKEAFAPIFKSAVNNTLTLIYEPEAFFIQEINNLNPVNYSASFKSLSRYIKIRKESFVHISENLNEGNIKKNSAELTALVHNACQTLSLSDVENDINVFKEILDLEGVLETQVVENPENKDEDVFEEEIQEPVAVNSGALEVEASLDQEFEPIESVQNEQEAVEEPTQEKEPVIVNEQFEVNSETVNEQFEREEKPATVAEKHETEKISELHSSISVNQRYMFLNDLFEGNVAEYNKAIEDIEGYDSFDDSVEYLMQNYSRKYQWDMGSDEVKELLKVIFKKFR